MGNQVIVAIRHDVSETPSFESIHCMGLHKGERITKTFEEYNGIISSTYHHASDDVCLMVNNKGMTNIPCYLKLYNDESGKTPFEKMLQGYRRYRYSSVRKSRKTVNLPANDGEKVSIFGYLTDATDLMPANSFEIMKKAIEQLWVIDNGQIINCGWEHQIKGTPIVCLGTINADQTAMIELSKNLFNITALPFTKMQDLDKNISTNKERIVDFDEKMLATFGYNIVANEKDKTYI